jgi:hypothetical protein
VWNFENGVLSDEEFKELNDINTELIMLSVESHFGVTEVTD